MDINNLSVRVISDCRDGNARMRYEDRFNAILPGAHVKVRRVRNDLQAAGNLVDAIQARRWRHGVIVLNVAPRNEAQERPADWNGSPFGYVRVDSVDIFGTVEGDGFTLLQKVLGRRLELEVFEAAEVVKHLDVDEDTRREMVESQFRSCEFVPDLMAVVLSGKPLPSRRGQQVSELTGSWVWEVDCFGNLKTTILPEDVGFEAGKVFTFHDGRGRTFQVMAYRQLRQVPKGQPGLVIGSSGYQKKRWLELVVNGGSARKWFRIKRGELIRMCPENAAVITEEE